MWLLNFFFFGNQLQLFSISYKESSKCSWVDHFKRNIIVNYLKEPETKPELQCPACYVGSIVVSNTEFNGIAGKFSGNFLAYTENMTGELR